MERDYYPNERRRRGDSRERRRPDRSRSPISRDRRDDRRRERSPVAPSSRSQAPRGGQDHRYRDRRSSRSPPPPSRPYDDGRRRQSPPRRDNRATNGTAPDRSGPRPADRKDVAMQDTDDRPEEERLQDDLKRLMGFQEFRTTKDTKVPGNDKNYAVYKVQKSEYRQYMNRVGGFNRPLSPSRM